jgi:hypothetical protein
MGARINSKYYFRIYKLLHPITGDVFYVGRTISTPSVRLKQHISTARCVTVKRKTKVIHYINSLLDSGLKPKIKVIKQGYGIGGQEIDFIKRYAKKYQLTNIMSNTLKQPTNGN